MQKGSKITFYMDDQLIEFVDNEVKRTDLYRSDYINAAVYAYMQMTAKQQQEAFAARLNANAKLIMLDIASRTKEGNK